MLFSGHFNYEFNRYTSRIEPHGSVESVEEAMKKIHIRVARRLDGFQGSQNYILM